MSSIQDQAQPAIAMTGVDKWYGAYHALKNVDFTVRKGECVVLCGPSGSGKSTLVRCINQLESCNQGRIVVGGLEVTAGNHRVIETVRRKVGMVFQQFNLFPHLSVLENCMLAPVKTGKLDRAQARAAALRLLDRVHVRDQADKYPAQLSGGQQQRVAIARALCMNPEIMLFDEPTSALDPEMVKEVLDTMVELAGDGVTMVCVTHEMGFARAVADRVVFMAAGEILEQASPTAFFESPRHERARSFVGQISARA
jgi:polar amino acid transport system ATP-binding protein